MYTLGGEDLVLHSISFWAACAFCAALVEAEDIERLIDHAVAALDADNRLGPVRRFHWVRHLRHTYQLFFENRIRTACTDQDSI